MRAGDVCYCFVCGAGLRAAQGSAQEVALEPYSEGLLLLSGLPQANGSTMRACSGAVLRSPMTWSVLLCASCVGGSGRCSRSTTGTCAGGDLARGGGAVRVLAGLRPADFVVLVTISVVWDTPLDCHFSAWSRPEPAPDPLPGPSVASGVIPTKGGRNGPVPATSGRAPEGRWRSSPWKRCNHAAPRSRVREHPAPLGALRPERLTILPA